MNRYRAFYDHRCALCRTFVWWLRRLDRHHKVACLPIDPQLLSRFAPQLPPDACATALHVVGPDGAVFAGWDAVMVIAQQCPSTRWLGWLGRRPLLRFIGQRIYQWLASHRYAFGSVCSVPEPKKQSATPNG